MSNDEEMNNNENRRRHDRYETDVEIYFHVGYDLETKVEYQLIGDDEHLKPPRYSAVSKNISCDGISFISDQSLDKEDVLYMEVFIPAGKKPIVLVGEVRWSKVIKGKDGGGDRYETGIRLISVNGKPVIDTIYFDEEYHLMWSDVLEAILGTFRKFVREQKIPKKKGAEDDG